MGQRDCIHLGLPLPLVFSVLLLLAGCTSKPKTSGVHFPVTSGSHTQLPSPHQRILIWGDPLLARVTEEWLRAHHYSNILMPPEIPRPSSDRQAAIVAAAEANAEFVLMLEREELKDGALIQAHCGTFFNIQVDVRGLSVERGERVLRGNAHYPHCVERHDQTIRHLTCQALATAWGFRPSGQLEIPSHLACTAGQNQPIPNR